MKLNGLLKVIVCGTASIFLMGRVLNSNATQPLFKPATSAFFKAESLQADTPQVQLPYNFKDNEGRQPQYDDKNKLYLNTPSNIKTETEYDPKTGNYNVSQKMGNLRYRPDTYIESEDYQNYMFKKSVGEYWRTRIKADDLNNKPKKGIVPKLQVNSEIFDRIFGGNTVDIRPTGTAELIFGLNRNKTLNPAIPQRQQKVTNFDFNMRIQLNLIGKIGDKLKITTSYNTEASFDWENQVKLDYTGYEDEIIKKIEAGNVTMPLNSSLITGSQSLFGIKTQLQFGRLTATTVFSQQRGKKQEVNIQGGAQTQQFQVAGDNYEANKHFFLSHYFRDNYDSWMSTLPIINTPVVITRVEVYVLNQTGNQEQVRSVVAFEDLGEDSVNVHPNLRKYGNVSNPCLSGTSQGYAIYDSAGVNPLNGANNLYNLISDPNTGILKARDAALASGLLTGTSFATNICNTSTGYMVQGRDFDRIATARKLNANEYTLNNRLGFISLNQAINNDQALAISFQYSYNGKTYQVGEFSDQFPDNTKCLFTKLLKGSITNVRYPMWDLMMKNVYSIGAYNLNQQDFRLDVLYNNIETGVDVNYIPFGAINGQQLIRVLDCDKLNANGDKAPDGVFDYLPGYTINPANGRIYFTSIEPFGTKLYSKFDPNNDFPNANKYIFQELYDSTRISAQQRPEKNRFKIKGSFKSASGSEISLNALNIPQGAVQVTANGVRLNENTDYTVDYTLGRVKIINESILNSGAQIKVSVESNSLFNVQQKSLMGTRLDFKVNRDLTLGGTLLRYAEKPVTQKVNTGDEPVSNIIWGTDYNYKTDVPFMTRLLDKLPLYSTKEMSNITTQGEFAQLVPGNAAAIGKNGTSYVDDFEGSVSVIDIRNPQAWSLASIPQGIPGAFPEGNQTDTILTGMNRARFNWYTIDPSLTREQNNYTPSNYLNHKKDIFPNNFFRQVFETELFPGKTPPNGQQVVMPVLDLGFYPKERGPYNYDVNKIPGFTEGVNKTTGELLEPQTRWGGIMRRLETNDFQAANIEYIQFWMMDPFNEDYNTDTHPDMDPNSKPTGDLYINLGNVSEDILKDGHMSYENGIPGQSAISNALPTVSTRVAVVPTLPPIANAFSSDENDRVFQDVGYDGMDNPAEIAKFGYLTSQMTPGPNDSLALHFQIDPSSDSYHHFRGTDFDDNDVRTFGRYSKYNNPEGNSPTEKQYSTQNTGYPTSATNVPNIEDINKDNTLSETESYYQYHVRISKQDIDPTNVGNNFIVNSFDGSATVEGINKTVKWYQFKVPISEFESVVGGIEGFNSIRFMRVYMKGFTKPVVVRLARFELVRSDWRRYAFDLTKPGEYIANDDNTTSFDVSAVSVQENGQKTPVNYVIPPGISQQQNIQTTNLVLQNEQALQLRVNNLKDGDSRAIWKNVDFDMRMFKHIKMFLHGEKVPPHTLNNGDLTVFVRIGSDYNNNYYEYEVPLTVTSPGYYDPNSDDGKYSVWPSSNEINIPLEILTNAKEERNQNTGKDLGATLIPYSVSDGNNKITVVGNPNLGAVKTIMIGVRNPKDNGALPHYVEVWVNELRLTDFNNKGGWATTGRIQAKLADLGNVSLAGTYSKPFFGSVEKKINERSKETTFNWDMTSTFQVGKFFPSKWKVNLPVYYSYGETKVTPLFNPYEPDVALAGLQANDKFSAEDIRNIKRNSQDYTQRKGLNFTNVKIDGLKRKGAKPMPWDISNFAVTYAYTEMFRRNVNIDHNNIRQYKGNITYGFQLQPKPWRPFDKMKIFDNKWFAIIKEFSLQPLPNRFGLSMDVTRNYSELLNRDITSFYTGTTDKTLTQFNKQFLFNRVYDFRWDFSKALKFDYNATMDGRYRESFGAIDTQEKKDSIKHEFVGLGTNVGFRQAYNVNYQVPINKIPILDFVSATYRYGGTYTWQRRPFAAVDTIGNTIQNTNSQTYNLSFNMLTFYNKIPYFRKINSGIPSAGGKKPPKGKNANPKGVGGDTLKEDSGPDNFGAIAEFLARGVMMIKNVTITYAKTNGQALPNFKPSSRYIGMDDSKAGAPGLPFIAGSQQDIRQEAADKGWLAHNLVQTTPYTQTATKNLTYRTTIEPHGSLKIELNGLKNESNNLSEYMRWDTLDHTFHFDESKTQTGNFSISAFTLGKSFKDKPHGVESSLFTEFLQTRQNYAEKLSAGNTAAEYGNGHSIGLQTNSLGKPYYDGYGLTQQDVLMGAFYETYTGRKIKNYDTKHIFPGMPMPNWTIAWDGLGKLKPMKKLFRSLTLRSGYRSTYTIGGYSNNLLYADDKGNGKTIGRSPVANPDPKESSNFVPYYSATSVVLSEAFAPLIKFDLQFNKPGWQGNFEIKKDKTVTLNLTGPQIIETKGQEYVVGIGYRYPKLTFKKVAIQGKPLQSDLNVKIDLSYRRNVSIIRGIVNEISTPTGGTDIITLRSAIDYQLTQNINLRLFYDWIHTKPQTSASFPTANVNAGFSLRINLQ